MNLLLPLGVPVAASSHADRQINIDPELFPSRYCMPLVNIISAFFSLVDMLTVANMLCSITRHVMLDFNVDLGISYNFMPVRRALPLYIHKNKTNTKLSKRTVFRKSMLRRR